MTTADSRTAERAAALMNSYRGHSGPVSEDDMIDVLRDLRHLWQARHGTAQGFAECLQVALHDYEEAMQPGSLQLTPTRCARPRE